MTPDDEGRLENAKRMLAGRPFAIDPLLTDWLVSLVDRLRAERDAATAEERERCRRLNYRELCAIDGAGFMGMT